MERSTVLAIPPNSVTAVSDVVAIVILAVVMFYAIRFWKAALQAAALIAVVSLTFTPLWDGFWTLVTKDWVRKHSGVTTVLRGEPQPVVHLISNSDRH